MSRGTEMRNRWLMLSVSTYVYQGERMTLESLNSLMADQGSLGQHFLRLVFMI